MDNTKEIIWSVSNILRGAVQDRYSSYLVLMALCHAKKAMLETAGTESQEPQCAEDLVTAVHKSGSDAQVSHLVEDALLSDKFLANARDAVLHISHALPADIDSLVDIILNIEVEEEFASQFMRGDGITPGSISELAARILSIHDGERVGDFCTGTGSFLVKAAKQADCELVYGCDVNSDSVAIAKIRAEAIGPNVVVEQSDMFHIDETFDKCFSNYPFSVKSYGFKEDALRCLADQGYADLPRFSSSDWLFNLQIIARLREDGKAVAIMTRGGSFNGADEKIRQHFVANGWVEAVVALPAGMFSPYTNIPTTLLVLSKGNDSVRLVDASGICQKGRRETVFSNEDIQRILGLLSGDSDGLSCTLAYDELAKDAFIFNPERHLGENIEVENGASIESLSINITRGSGWAKKQLEELNSNSPTKFRYLMLRNIVDGEIEDDLPYLTEIDASQERYCVRNGDLLLSKIGPNFKVAVANVPEDEKVLATGNLYIIRFDDARIDPRYAKLYLESDQGVAQLRRACVGTTMPSIPAKAFADILIPMISLDEQQDIVSKYESIQQEIAVHKLAIERARQRMANLISEG